MLGGIAVQSREDSLLRSGCFGHQVADDDVDVLKEMYSPKRGFSGKYRGDIIGQVLG